MEINANITDNTDVSLVILQYSDNNNSWQNVTMQYNIIKKVFVGAIPEHEASTIVVYRILAMDQYNNSIISATNKYTVLPADTNNPIYHKILTVPAEPTEKDNVIVTANVSDDSEIFFVILTYSVNQNTWSNLTMTLNKSTGLYYTMIPRQNVGDNISFYLIAQDCYENVGISKWFFYSVHPSDNRGPIISNVEYIPVNPTNQDNVIVTAEVTDESNVSIVVLSFYEGTAWKNTTMRYNVTLARYKGAIPRLPAGSTISFKIYANDSLDSWSVSQVYSYEVAHSSNTNSQLEIIQFSTEALMITSGLLIGFFAIYVYHKHLKIAEKTCKDLSGGIRR